MLRLYWKSLKLPTYRERILERLGFYKSLVVAPHGVVIHAVSVGEVVAAVPLVKALQAQYPALSITITTTTPTGAQRVKQSFGDKVLHMYVPYDIPWIVTRWLNKVRPSCVIIMETEIWPNLINSCYKHKIPTLIANACLSDSSFSGYKRINFFIKKILQQLTCVAAQSRMDGERFESLGLPTDKLQITGNLKFDVLVNKQQQDDGKLFKEGLGNRLVWVVASTHAGEETQILSAFKEVQKNHQDLLLILIPRHPDRFKEVAELLIQHKINFIQRSKNQACTNSVSVMLGDTMGELGMYYSIADVAFVGGSLVPIGGHNLLEPAALGIPCITGPYTYDCKETVVMLEQAAALIVVHNAAELAQQVKLLLDSIEYRAKIAANALQVVMQNRGSVQKIMQIINCCLDQDTCLLEAVVTKY